MDPKTERTRAIATDLEDMRKRWFDEGVEAGATLELARIKAVEQQSMPGHEDLIEQLKFDGKTTGEQAAVLILAAERKKLTAMSDALRLSPQQFAGSFSTENTTGTAQKMEPTMSADQVANVARQEWQIDPTLHREFASEAQYVAFRKAEAQGRVRVLEKARVQ